MDETSRKNLGRFDCFMTKIGGGLSNVHTQGTLCHRDASPKGQFVLGTLCPGDVSSWGHYVLWMLRLRNVLSKIASSGDASSGGRFVRGHVVRVPSRL
jgi:hypothetical protein